MEVEVDDGKGDEVQQHSVDLASLIAHSSGHGQIEKLVFISKATKGNPMELQALKMAHDLSKKVRRMRHAWLITLLITARMSMHRQKTLSDTRKW